MGKKDRVRNEVIRNKTEVRDLIQEIKQKNNNKEMEMGR